MGFQIVEQYSRTGLTNVQKASVRRIRSRERKQCKINLARRDALPWLQCWQNYSVNMYGKLKIVIIHYT